MTDDQGHLEAIRHRHRNMSVPYPQDRGHFETCAWMRQADTDLGQLLLVVDALTSQIKAAATDAQDLIAVNDALRVAYRAAVGVPPSEHQIRRLETMAQRLEECQAELRRLKGEVTA